jgi:YbgC/YbaW family acyl-CoA thioester hydrolase
MEYPRLENPEKNPSSAMRVRFQDCDPFRHLNNARYAEYFFEAREDHLRDFYGFDVHTVTESEKKGWVVAQMETAFLKPALQNERVRIVTRLKDLGESLIGVEGLMLDEAGRELKSVMHVRFIFIDLARGRPARHGAQLMSFLSSVRYDAEEIVPVFGERTIELRKQVREGRYHAPIVAAVAPEVGAA